MYSGVRIEVRGATPEDVTSIVQKIEAMLGQKQVFLCGGAVAPSAEVSKILSPTVQRAVDQSHRYPLITMADSKPLAITLVGRLEE